MTRETGYLCSVSVFVLLDGVVNDEAVVFGDIGDVRAVPWPAIVLARLAADSNGHVLQSDERKHAPV